MGSSLPLKQEVAEQHPWLFQKHGFCAVEENFDSANFGNSFVTLESPRFRVRFVRDRGQVSAEVASLSQPEVWWNLEHICELISGRAVVIGLELPEVAALLKNNIAALADYLGANYPQTRIELERRAEERRRAVFRRFSQ